MLCFISTQLVLLTLLVIVSRPADSWMTTYQANFQMACPAGQNVRRLESFFGVGQYDRVWNMSCGHLPSWVELNSCEWSGSQNNYNEVLIFQCPSDYIVTGIASTYDRSKLDRIWSFQCCNPQDYVTHECMYTSFINTIGDVMNYRVPNDHVLRGMESIYDQNRRYVLGVDRSVVSVYLNDRSGTADDTHVPYACKDQLQRVSRIFYLFAGSAGDDDDDDESEAQMKLFAVG